MANRDLAIVVLALVAQEGDGMFAMIARRFNKFIQDAPALFLRCLAIAFA
jgi:hypothetical protein